MKSGAFNHSQNRAKNTGLYNRAPAIAELELQKAVRATNNAFSVNSVSSRLHKYEQKGRRCSCFNYMGTDGEAYSEDEEFSGPVVIIDQTDDIDDETSINEILTQLEAPKDICPICFATGYVGNYRLINSFELWVDTTATIKKYNVEIEKGRPGYFIPSESNSSIVFRTSLPAYYSSLDRITYVPTETREHTDFDTSLIKIGPAGGARVDYTSITLEDYVLANGPTFDIEFFIEEKIHAFFIRLLNGRDTIMCNFPEQALTIEEGEYDLWETSSIIVEAKEEVSTHDILIDSRYGTTWKITGVTKKSPREINLGQEVDARRARFFEVQHLIP